MKYPAQPLTRPEVLAILDAIPDNWYGKRNRALIITLWRAGLRIAEALALEVYDFNPYNCSLTVRHGKGDRSRTVGIDHQATEEIIKWTLTRGDQPGWLFPTRKGGQIQSAYIRSDLLPRLRRRSGVQKRVHAHAFRHTFAFELAMEGIPVEIIRKQLGHTNLGTTTQYLDHLGAKDVIDAMRERTW